MPFSLKHAFTSLKADGSDNSLIQPSDWNAEHVLTATEGKLLGTSGSTTVGEITVGTGLTLSGGTLTASAGGSPAASSVTFTPTGAVAATDVQAAIAEVDSEKAPKGAVTSSGLTMATARILGRTTGSSGAVEEISVGSGLSLSGGSLTATGGSGSGIPINPNLSNGATYHVSALAAATINQNTTTLVLIANQLYLYPFVIGTGRTFTRIGCNVTTAAAAGTFLRTGFYSDSSGAPGSLLFDSGAMATSATGLVEATISQNLSAGLYWVALVADSTPTVRSINWLYPGNLAHLGLSSSFSGVSQLTRSYTYGALPASESGQTYTFGTSNPPIVYLRIA